MGVGFMMSLSKTAIEISFLFLIYFTLPAYAEEVFSQDSAEPKLESDKKTVTSATVNRKTIERLRERVAEYLAYRPQGPKLYYLQKYFEYKFSIPTTDRKPFLPELQDKLQQYFKPLDEKTKKESLELIDNIQIDKDDDN